MSIANHPIWAKVAIAFWALLIGNITLAFPTFEGQGNAETPYQIGSRSDLQALAQWVNAGNDCEGLHFALSDAINLQGNTETPWIPIGCVTDWNTATIDTCKGTPFNGVFDGKSLSISRLYLRAGEEANITFPALNTPVDSCNFKAMGLFGFLGPKAVVKNLFITDATFSGNDFVGGVAGYNAGGKIENVTVSDCRLESLSYVGTIVGYNKGEIVKCSAHLSPSEKCGIFGGITAVNNGGFIAECEVIGTDSITALGYAGGITAHNLNRGQIITSYVEFSDSTFVFSAPYLGGVVVSNDANAEISYSSVLATLESEGQSAGFVMINRGTIQNVFSATRIHAKTAQKSAFCAENYGTLANVYYDADIVGVGAVNTASATPKATAEMQGNNPFSLALNLNVPDSPFVTRINNYPQLSWKVRIEGIIFVRTDGNDDYAGYTWSSALRSLQKAIDLAATKGWNEVWIAEGDYPLTRNSITEDPNKRTCGIYLRPNISVRGSFTVGAVNPDARDFKANPTRFYRAGEDGNFPLIRIFEKTDIGISAENCTLDGVILDGMGHLYTVNENGSAVTCNAPSPSFYNCTFKNCKTNYNSGVAVYIWANNRETTAMFKGCTFTDNSVATGQNDFADGGCIVIASVGTFNECIFANNQSSGRGGCIFAAAGSAEISLRNCLFAYNCDSSQSTSVPADGTAIYSFAQKTDIVNCTFAYNKGDNGTLVKIAENGTGTRIVNSIFYGNETPSYTLDVKAGTNVKNSLIQAQNSGTVTTACLTGNPRFTKATATAGTNPSWADADFTPKSNSICVNTGDSSVFANQLDLANNPRIFVVDSSSPLLIDMGAFEFQGIATDSTTPYFASATSKREGVELNCPKQYGEDLIILRAKPGESFDPIKTDFRGGSFTDESAVPGQTYKYKLKRAGEEE